MSIQLHYTPEGVGPLQSVTLLMKKPGGQLVQAPMQEVDGVWALSRSFPEGEYHYAFLIDQQLRLNDPQANVYAPDDQEKIWSVLLVNAEGQRLYNNQEYKVHLEDYRLSAHLERPAPDFIKKKFHLGVDQQVVAHWLFTEVQGLHSVTVAWSAPDGQLVQWGEQYLVENEHNTPIELAFACDLTPPQRRQQAGAWSLRLYIDGAFVLEDEFTISRDTTYSKFG